MTGNWQTVVLLPSQMEYERQVASLKAASAAENDFSVSQAEVSSRQAMLENASDIKVGLRGFLPPSRPGKSPFSHLSLSGHGDQ